MNFSIKIDQKTWQKYMAVHVKGRAALCNPFINKGSAFSSRERNELGLLGLLPAHITRMEDQLQRNYENFQGLASDLEKFKHLEGLHDRNETLFYRFPIQLPSVNACRRTPSAGPVDGPSWLPAVLLIRSSTMAKNTRLGSVTTFSSFPVSGSG